jgi:hypothetical protein
MKAQTVTEIPVQLHRPDRSEESSVFSVHVCWLYLAHLRVLKAPQSPAVLHIYVYSTAGDWGDKQNIQHALNNKYMQNIDHTTEEAVEKKAKKRELTLKRDLF